MIQRFACGLGIVAAMSIGLAAKAECDGQTPAPDAPAQAGVDPAAAQPPRAGDATEVEAPTERAGQGVAPLPEGDLFPPLIADLKQPRFSGALERVRASDADRYISAAFVSFGEEFGLWADLDNRGGWQVSVLAGVFAQFNLDPSTSYALINADYVIGLPVSWRRDAFAVRARFYHQSSHLGDELLLANPDIKRINLSFEELEILASWDLPRWHGRVYGGGGVLVHRHPDLDRFRVQGGFEWHGRSRQIHSGSSNLAITPLAAVDVKAFAELGWNANVHLLAGVRLSREHGGRAVQLHIDHYRGHYPYGQFYGQRIRSLGLGVSLAF